MGLMYVFIARVRASRVAAFPPALPTRRFIYISSGGTTTAVFYSACYSFDSGD